MKRPPDPTPAQRLVTNWGKNLQNRRREMKMSQTTLAQRVHVDQTTISRLEHGKGAWSPEIMLSLAVTLNARVEFLFPWTDGIETLEIYRIETAKKKRVA